EYSEYIDDSGRRISITGTPNLSNIRTIMIGIRNRQKENNILPDDGLPKSIDVWMNELRLAGFNEHGGWATRGRLQANLADFSTIALATEYSTPGFGGLEESVDQRQQSTNFNYDFSVSTELGKFFPKKYGIRIPLYFGYSETKNNPEYDPLNPDIKMTATLRNMSQKERIDYLKISQDYIKRKSVNITNIRISGNSEKKKRKKKNISKGNTKNSKVRNLSRGRKITPIWALSNWTASYGYNELLSRNINTNHNLLKIHTGAISYNYNITPKNIKPFSKVKLFRKKAFRIIKDFNFYYMPSMIAFRTDIRKSYNEVLLRNIENSDVMLTETYDKQFIWNRNYDLRYNLSRNLKFTYSANNVAWIGEPEGKIDKTDEQKWKDYKNSVLDSIQNFGRTTDFHQKLSGTWNIPVNQLPMLDWINANARYDADYYWTIGPRTADSTINLGNTIRNNQRIQLTSQANFERLYRKVKFLKNVDNKFKGRKKKTKKKFKNVKFIKEGVTLKKNKPRSITHNLKTENVKLKVTDSKGNEIKGRTVIVNENKVKFYAQKSAKKTKIEVTGKKEVKENIFNVISDYTLYALMSVRNISLTYSQNNGTVVPGYMRKSNYMGFEKLSLNNLNNNAPGWKFITGVPDSHFAETAAANHWLSGDTLLNAPLIQNGDITYNFRATLKPIKGLRIDVTAERRESHRTQEFWVSDDFGRLHAQNQSYEGSFSMSFLSIKTAFDKINDTTYQSDAYDQFLANRVIIAHRLADNRQNADIPYNRNQLNNPDSLDDYVNKFPYGYNPTSQDVMLPAFLAAYSGQDANSIGMKLFRVIPFPNWRLKYDGLTYYDGIKRYFKRITINHGYRSSYSVASFQSNSAFENYNETGFTDIQDQLTSTYYVTELLADAVTLDEKFIPLAGIDMQWRNDMSTKLEYKQSRMLTLSFSNNTITELIRKEYVIGLGYKVPDLEIPMMIQGNQKLFKSDLNFRFDFTYSDNFAVIRRIKEADNQLSAGQKNLSVKVSVDYNLDKVTLRLFYDRIVNTPRVSTAFRTSNTHIGFSLRFNLANI
ncbi:MAG: cell surface protein SprA, partial [Bacteroidales bacterium]|nr:cell surface protein SprA [Bacteroidales bacterium]